MKLDARRLSWLQQGDDPAEVIHDHLEDFGDTDYMDNLLRLCEMGGWPDENTDPEYSVEKAYIDGDVARANVSAYFDEKVFDGGCPDMPTIASRRGQVEFIVYLETGDISWASHKE